MSSFPIGIAFSSSGPIVAEDGLLIIAKVAPAIQPVPDGTTLADTLPASATDTANYKSTGGSIVSAVAEWSVNGGAWTFDGSVILAYGESVQARIRVTDSENNDFLFNTSSTTVSGVAPSNTIGPIISGGSALGDVLVVESGGWTGTPAPSLVYQWMRGSLPVVGATTTTYTITQDDDAAEIACTVTATNEEGSASATSNTIRVTGFVPPVNVVAPSISGNPTVGATLTCDPGSWTAIPAPSLSYQWYRDGAVISGATGSGYMLQTVDIGAEITCVVTAENIVGTVTATSNMIRSSEITLRDPGDNTLEISGAGTLDSIMIEGGLYAGTYTTWADGAVLDLDALSGVVAKCLVAPILSGTGGVAETLTVAPGLWVYDASNPEPSIAYTSSGSGSMGGTAAAPTYEVQSDDAGSSIIVTEAARSGAGADVSQDTNAIAIAGAATFDPASLNEGAQNKCVFWLDFTDAASMQTKAGMPPALGDTPILFTDKSGTGNDFTTGDAAASSPVGIGTYQGSYTNNNVTSTGYLTPASALTGLTADMCLHAVIDTRNDGNFMLVGTSLSSVAAGVASATNYGGATPLDIGFGGPITYSADGTPITPSTRAELHGLWTTNGTYVVVSAEGLDLTGTTPDMAATIRPLSYSSAVPSYGVQGRVRQIVCTTNDLTPDERVALVAWLTAKAAPND
ncbi:hypothetical protein [Rhodovulum marinum]|uniref:Ig-like domain-containing protein n=1 Tax=Rhodovulum marinum TaxID=320662 RepID=A0A4R2PZ50_9RHOB|nr:hypothetical protein [Rhodovulum marinum]TCP39575.1 hypothetical protein EV662_11155 [Rhodovulum marinum]